MKKVLILAILIVSCRRGYDKQLADEPLRIVQTCVDSLNKKINLNLFLVKFNRVVLEKTRYFPNKPYLKWGESNLQYQAVPDSLEKTIWELKHNKNNAYVLKLDTLSYDSKQAFVRLLSITQRFRIEYHLIKLHDKWAINNILAVDYEENPGPNIIK